MEAKRKQKILILDADIKVRQRLNKVLSENLRFEILGVAANHEIALLKVKQLRPDCLICDIQGLEDTVKFIRALRKENSLMKILMFSSETSMGAPVTLEVINAGANDYLQRLEDFGNDDRSAEFLKNKFIPKLMQMLALNSTAAEKIAHVNHVPINKESHRNFRTRKIDAIAIGSSTGGPDVLELIFSQLSGKMGLPIFIAQHMPKDFTQQLAERLSRVCRMPIVEARDSMIVEADHCYIAPGGKHMIVVGTAERKFIRITDTAPVNSCKPSVDVLFNSLASSYKGNVLTLILTGMGQDGFLGAKQLYSEGGIILVQDEETSLVWGMPGIVFQSGIAEKKLPKDEIAKELIDIVSNYRLGFYEPQ